MSPEDLAVIRDVRRQLERRSIDSTLAVVSCTKGFVTIAGTLRRLRSDPFSDLNEELELFRKLVFRHVREVKSLSIEARIVKIEAEKKKEHHEAAQQTPHLPGHGPVPGAAPK